MFEAEYARRRTTAEAEAGRICSGDTVYLAGGPLLPVDFAAALHRRAAELHGVRVLNYLPLEPLALLTDPACGDAFQIESIFTTPTSRRPSAWAAAPFCPTTCAMRPGTGPTGRRSTTAWYSRSPLWTSMAAFPWRARPALSWRCSPAPGGWWWRWPPVLPGSSGT